jgi:SAM-dependent methyltransferase
MDPRSAKTQIATTVGTYRKAGELLHGRVLDYGAGLGLGADELRKQGLKVQTFEPFPQRWKSAVRPSYRRPDDVPSDTFDSVICLNVLNVVDRRTRDGILREFARVLLPGGTVVLNARSVADVSKASVKEPGPEPGSWFIGRGDERRYQKGFTQDELEKYVRSLGWINVRKVPGLGGVSVVMTNPGVRSNPAGTDDEYVQAVADMDTAKATDMVGAKARAAGYVYGPVYHGTTHDWTVFDQSRANIENDFGRALYFTTSRADAERNYRGMGPDLTNKVERLTEHYESLGEPKSKARKRALRESKGKVEKVLECYLRMRKPFVIGTRNETRLNLVTDDDGVESGDLLPFLEALQRLCVRHAVDYPAVFNCINEAADFDLSDFRASVLIRSLKQCDALAYAEGDDGVFIMNELIRQTIEQSGYDGIIDHEVATKWPKMGIPAGTSHLLVFQPNQVKLADVVTLDDRKRIIPLSKRFDDRSPDLRNPRQNPMSPTLRKRLSFLLEPSDRVLNYDTAKGEELYRLYDVVVTDQPLNGEALTEIEGLLDDNGVLVILSGEMPPGLEDHFKRAVRHRGMLLVQHPRNPEEARINAEKQRRES